jgi:predicted alpha/beta hydrolase family esterase
MLARLQRITTLSLLGLAMLWALLALQHGHPWWAAGGAALVVFGYALVLGGEFLLLRLAYGDDPAPRPTPSELLRSWAAEVSAAPRVFCWRQPFRSQRWPDRIERGPSCRGVVLVHGFVCNRGLWNPWLQRLHTRGVPCIAVNLEPVFGSIDAYVPIVDTAVRRLHDATGLAPVIVAHSMGGLAVRRWWVDQASDRVHHVITIATPHTGTALARLALSPSTRQMRRQSPWLRALANREPPGRAAQFTCFYSHCDNIVFPPSTATLPGADNRHLRAVPHVHMADRPEPWQALLDRLGEP